MKKLISIILFSLVVNISLAETTYSKQLENRASNGDASAQEWLGWCYLAGAGIDKDFEKAFYWYKKAADVGRSYAMYSIGIMYHNGYTDKTDEYEAAKWFERAYAAGYEKALEMLKKYDLPEVEFEYKLIEAAENDDWEAQHELATWIWKPTLKRGSYNVFDEKRAFDLLKSSADNDYVASIHDLAVMYMQGVGTEKDEVTGAKYYKKAAELGLPISQYSYALCCIHGRGVEKNYDEAIRWMTKAADNGFAEAMFELGAYHQHGSVGILMDLEKAVEWYKKGAKLNSPKALLNLGYCYDNGIGTPKDFWMAVQCYGQSANLGNKTAYENLEILAPQIRKKFPKYFKQTLKLAEEGDRQSQAITASMYLSNLPGLYKINKLAPDQEAAKWILKAAENGYEDFYYLAGEIYETGKVPSVIFNYSDLSYSTKDGDHKVINTDINKAVHFYNLAIESKATNRALSLLKMANAYYNGSDLIDRKDDQKMVNLLKETIQELKKSQNSSELKDSYLILSKCYAEGRGVDKDLILSEALRKKAVRMGNVPHSSLLNSISMAGN